MRFSCEWQKSTYSGGTTSNECVEVGWTGVATIGIRESDAPAAVVETTTAALRALLGAVKAGALDGLSPVSAAARPPRGRRPDRSSG